MFSVVIIIEYSSIYCLQVLNLFTSNLHPCCKQKLSVIFNSKTEKSINYGYGSQYYLIWISFQVTSN